MPEYSDNKKTRILNAAAELFSERPFHKVLLDEVARAAGVGKGTLYLYFTSKEDLYLSVLFREFSELITNIQKINAKNPDDPKEQISGIVDELIKHLYDNAVFFELLRGAIVHCPDSNRWNEKRIELRRIIQQVINNGIDKGVFHDPTPSLSAQYIPGIIRSVCLFRPEGMTREAIFQHARQFVLNALQAS